MKKLAALALITALIASASLASAQSASNPNYLSQMPLISPWGSQASTTATPMAGIAGVQPLGQTAPVGVNTSFQGFWAQMPMLQLFNLSP